MGMLLGTSVWMASNSLMLCTLRAWRQGRRTCGKADRCRSICTMYVKKHELAFLSQLADFTRLRGTDRADITFCRHGMA
jgi:hypothetical protein